MISVIIYATDATYLNRTIRGIQDRTPDLKEVIVCDDAGVYDGTPGAIVLRTGKVGRARAWNAAATQATGDILVFVKDKTKVGDDWTVPLVESLTRDPNALVSPVVHTLDLGLWMAEASRWKRFGWRWDLNIYDRPHTNRAESPAISSYCIATTRVWFENLGGFDPEMGTGAGEDIELSLRSWLYGGAVRVVDGCSIAVGLEVDYNTKTLDNLARIAETWFPEHASHFYNARRVTPQQVNVGRLPNHDAKQRQPVEWFFATKQPELVGIYDLRGAASGKTVAVVAPGASLDLLNPAVVLRHDLVIGVDYVGMLFDCDFVITDSTHVVAELRRKYAEQKFVVPLVLEDRTGGAAVAAVDVVPLAQQFELARGGSPPVALEPPFCNYDSMVLAAAHFALFIGARSVTVFGHDGKLLGGRSHTSKIEYYDDGKLWPDADSTRRHLALVEHGFDQLGRLALSVGVPLLRVSHA